jgi:hypothetical protein
MKEMIGPQGHMAYFVLWPGEFKPVLDGPVYIKRRHPVLSKNFHHFPSFLPSLSLTPQITHGRLLTEPRMVARMTLSPISLLLPFLFYLVIIPRVSASGKWLPTYADQQTVLIGTGPEFLDVAPVTVLSDPSVDPCQGLGDRKPHCVSRRLRDNTYVAVASSIAFSEQDSSPDLLVVTVRLSVPLSLVVAPVAASRRVLQEVLSNSTETLFFGVPVLGTRYDNAADDFAGQSDFFAPQLRSLNVAPTNQVNFRFLLYGNRARLAQTTALVFFDSKAPQPVLDTILFWQPPRAASSLSSFKICSLTSGHDCDVVIDRHAPKGVDYPGGLACDGLSVSVGSGKLQVSEPECFRSRINRNDPTSPKALQYLALTLNIQNDDNSEGRSRTKKPLKVRLHVMPDVSFLAGLTSIYAEPSLICTESPDGTLAKLFVFLQHPTAVIRETALLHKLTALNPQDRQLMESAGSMACNHDAAFISSVQLPIVSDVQADPTSGGLSLVLRLPAFVDTEEIRDAVNLGPPLSADFDLLAFRGELDAFKAASKIAIAESNTPSVNHIRDNSTTHRKGSNSSTSTVLVVLASIIAASLLGLIAMFAWTKLKIRRQRSRT